MDTLIDEEMTDAEAEALLSEEVEPPEVVSRETAESDAPFGRFKNGKARKTAARSRRSPAAPAAPVRPVAPSRKPSRSKSGAPDYVQMCRGFIAIPEAIVGVLAASKSGEAAEKLAADALTISTYADSLSAFGAKMAERDARIAAALESVAKGSPMMEGLLVVIPFVMQLGANHDRIKPVEALGVVSRETLLNGVRETVSEGAEQ